MSSDVDGTNDGRPGNATEPTQNTDAPEAKDVIDTKDAAQPRAPTKAIGRFRRGAAQAVLLLAFGLDLLLYSLVVPFLPQEAKRLGASPLVIGLLFATYAAGLFAVTPLAARLTDRAGPRRTLLLGLIALGGSTLLFAYSPMLALGIPGLFIARAAQGGASTLTWTAGLAVLVQLYPAEEHPRLFARAFTVTGLSALIGPPLGGALYSIGGFRLPFLVATGLVVIDGLGRLLLLPGNRLLPGTHPQRAMRRLLLGDSVFRLGLFAAMAGALALSSLEPVTPLLLSVSFGMPPWAIGVAFGALALCFVIMQPLVSRSERRLGARWTIFLGLTFVALCFAGIALVTRRGTFTNMPAPSWLQDIIPSMHSIAMEPVAVMALLAMLGCALALVVIPAPSLLTSSGQRLAGAGGAAYGVIFASYSAADALGTLLGPVLTGGAVATQGVEQSFLLLAIAPAVSALIIPFWRTRTRLPAPAKQPRSAPINEKADEA
ncbi:MAG TPA: MFS transporter [Ktedonobacterales bacterium]|nr:MFS transporter [Ktedonobacterales bacterium]